MTEDEAKPALDYVRSLHALQSQFAKLPASLRFELSIAYFAAASSWDGARVDASKAPAVQETFAALVKSAIDTLTKAIAPG